MADTSKKTKAGNFQTSVGVQRKSIEEKRDVNMGGLKWGDARRRWLRNDKKGMKGFEEGRKWVDVR